MKIKAKVFFDVRTFLFGVDLLTPSDLGLKGTILSFYIGPFALALGFKEPKKCQPSIISSE